MEPDLSCWTTHSWTGRRLELVPGQQLIQRVCNECGRAFVDELATGLRYAVHVSIFKLDRLSDEVTGRWLSENCAGKSLRTDDADRKTRFVAKTAGDAIPASPATTANALNAVRKGEYAKNRIFGQNVQPETGNANASANKPRQLPV